MAALSLGIDLGFGQPMEHVLRQCLIALRLAEQVGARRGRPGRGLLHRAARQRRLPHRRARAGEVVRRRHRAEVRQVRATSCTALRERGRRRSASRSGGDTPFAPVPGRPGVRGVRPPGPDGMIAHHSVMARRLGGARLSDDDARRRSAPPTSSGTGRAGRASSAARRCRSRPGSPRSASSPRSPTASAESPRRERSRGSGAASSSTPTSPTSSSRDAEMLLAGLDTADTWEP